MYVKVFVTMSIATFKCWVSIIDIQFDLNRKLKKNFLLKDCQKQSFAFDIFIDTIFKQSSNLKVWDVYCIVEATIVTVTSGSLIVSNPGDDSFSKYARFSEKLIFLTPWYAHVSGGKKC